jgi:putative ABC transport system substrate-binding protein
VKKILLIIFLMVIFCYRPSQAGQEILVVQSIRIKPYEEALKGFKSVCHSRIQRLVVSELEGADVVRKINEIRPAMILAVGVDALSMVKPIEDIPVVYLMVPNPQSILSGEKNITGVSMNIPQEKQLTALLDALPGTHTIGLLYDPNRTGHLVKRAQDFAAKIGVRLIAKEIHNPKEAPTLIFDMKDKIDVFWMLPDITVITPETVECLLLLSLENKIPLFTFSAKYVQMGAFMSMDIDAFDMGRQAGEMAAAIRAGKDAKDLHQVYARKAVVSTNLMIAKKLGIHLSIAMNSINKKIFRKALAIN